MRALLSRSAFALVAALLWSGATSARAQHYTVIDLGVDVQGRGINRFGDCTGLGVSTAFKYKAIGATMQNLGTLGGSFSSGQGINDLGQICGYSLIGGDSQEHAFLYDPALGGMFDIGVLGLGTMIKAEGINNHSVVTGFSQMSDLSDGIGSQVHAFRWDRTHGIVDLGTLPLAISSHGYAINDSNVVAGDSETVLGTFHAAIFDGTGVHDLGTLPAGGYSEALGINNAGDVVGEADVVLLPVYHYHAILSSHGAMRDLGTLGGSDSVAKSINASGTIVGWAFLADFWTGDPGAIEQNAHAFIRLPGGTMRDLNDLISPSTPGWRLTFANAINDGGEITGFGHLIDPATGALGPLHGFLLKPVSLLFPFFPYRVFHLASDISGVADSLDSAVVNPWGLAHLPGGGFLFAANGSGMGEAWPDTQTKNGPVSPDIIIPSASGNTSGQLGVPAGVVLNRAYLRSTDFPITAQKVTAPSEFVFVTEDGLICGWNPNVDPKNAVVAVDHSGSGADYTGVDIASTPLGENRLYVANFRAGTIEVYDRYFSPVKAAGGFVDPGAAVGFAPFNIKRFKNPPGGGRAEDLLYVAYALPPSETPADVASPGNGYINVFDTEGRFLRRLIDFPAGLNSPWGMALAPANFGKLGGALLVGSFGDGLIRAFDIRSGKALGTMTDNAGNPLHIPGLWALDFGRPPHEPVQDLVGDLEERRATSELYFTAGMGEEKHGLFGRIVPDSVERVAGGANR